MTVAPTGLGELARQNQSPFRRESRSLSAGGPLRNLRQRGYSVAQSRIWQERADPGGHYLKPMDSRNGNILKSKNY